MDHNQSELERVERWLGAIIQGLSPSHRAAATRKIATIVRGANAARIKAQIDPDGRAFAPARPSKERKPSNRALKFLYPSSGTGEPRVVLLKSWVKRGPLLTGFDLEAGAIRSFDKSHVVRWLQPSPDEQNKGAPALRTRATIKRRIMFRKLRTYARLRAGANSNEAWVGFTGKDGQIAGVHQRGEMDRPGPRAKQVRYAKRELLGLSPKDSDLILSVLAGMIDQHMD